MIKYIDHHWAKGGVLEFDTISGTIQKTSKYEWMKAPHWGTAWKQNNRSFVLHNDKVSFIFQTKSQKWRLSPDLNLSLRRILFFRQFKIARDGKPVFSIWYIPRYFYMAFIDPAHDDEDEEDDDFFLYLLNLWNTWKNKNYSDFLSIIEENKKSQRLSGRVLPER
ncbi:MAG: hypothetical protein OEZ13_11290 [Spirochaetia bacterium]|nr:hypothetical protein [Spirochaetia bacterium]